MRLAKFHPSRDIQRALRSGFLNWHVDYETFSVPDAKIEGDMHGYKLFLNLFRNFYTEFGLIDGDNSNELYFGNELELSLLRVNTPRGYMYHIKYTQPGFPSITIVTIEEYNKGAMHGKEVGCFKFPGAFHHFYEDLPSEIKDGYRTIREMWKDGEVKRTRVDIAFNFDIEIFKYSKYFFKSQNSKQDIHMFNPDDNGLPRSVSLLSSNRTGYGVRIYDKNIDIERKNKEWWYGGKDEVPQQWKRFEYELFAPYSNEDENALVSEISRIIFGKSDLDLSAKIVWKPKVPYNDKNSFKHLEKYSKNHGISVEEFGSDFIKNFIEKYGIKETQEIIKNAFARYSLSLSDFEKGELIDNALGNTAEELNRFVIQYKEYSLDEKELIAKYFEDRGFYEALGFLKSIEKGINNEKNKITMRL